MSATGKVIWLLLLALLPPLTAQAAQPKGWAYQLFVDRELWQQQRIDVAARLQSGLSIDNSGNELFSRDGFSLNRIELLLEKPLRSRVAPGGYADAGSRRPNWDWGFLVEARYGEDFNPLYGFDDDWGLNRAHRNKLSLPQWLLKGYAPLGGGTVLQLGNFVSPVGNEGDAPTDPPQPFYSRSLAYEYGPKRHVGGLLSSRLPLADEYGLWSVDLGLVQGWDNLQDNNDRPSLIAALHRRSRDKRLELDMEAIWGDEQSQDGITDQRPFVALSDDGRGLARSFYSLSLRHWPDADKRWRYVLNAVHGRQQGGDPAFDGGSDGLIVEDSEWYGANAALIRQLRDDLQLAVRYEWFRDRDGAHAERATGINRSWTLNLSWYPQPWLRVRPELRYDRFDGAFGVNEISGSDADQLRFSIDATVFL
ncbi:outer membrane beta-barrel protein [Marinobacterium arenosum]|uniref:outer membrane beta-barrel protein n=1 Tax=Marinobacterium arenosum TaxID=2862496 RepID=UPI001C95D404|nr:outer membrane beta-barrel protein [Marinobacterium arenosum]MBY4676164.1 porin [Marinobacterium arenosum]